MISGIYTITNRLNGKVYVGSAKHIKQRWAIHRHYLAHGTHQSCELQTSWDTDGASEFKFRIVEAVTDPEKLLEREQHWIDTLKPQFNTQPTAGSPLGTKRSEATRAKLRAIKKPWLAERNRTPEMRAISSANAVKRNKTPEQKAAVSAAKTGTNFNHTAEAVEKIRASKLGKKRPNNTSGYVGITFEPEEKLWRARTTNNGRRITIGRFKDLKDAVLAYERFTRELGHQISATQSKQRGSAAPRC